jgi:hypothetical protein
MFIPGAIVYTMCKDEMVSKDAHQGKVGIYGVTPPK